MKNKQELVNRIIDFYLTGHNLKENEAKAVISLKEEYKAINYTRCCTELKVKETMTFEEWKKENVVEENVCNEYLYKYGGWFDAYELLSMYKKDISL